MKSLGISIGSRLIHLSDYRKGETLFCCKDIIYWERPKERNMDQELGRGEQPRPPQLLASSTAVDNDLLKKIDKKWHFSDLNCKIL